MVAMLGIPAAGCWPEDPFADRAARVKAVAESHRGKVLRREGPIVHFEIPAEAATGVGPLLGAGGHAPIYQGQRFEPGSPRGISWFEYTIDLRPKQSGPAQPSAAAITAPVNRPAKP